VGDFPRHPTDLPLSLIVTPKETIAVKKPPPAPTGIDWALLSEEDPEVMPVLSQLRRGSAVRLPRRVRKTCG
jgi:5-formyltetrahydrofolate cyclo-ligase